MCYRLWIVKTEFDIKAISERPIEINFQQYFRERQKKKKKTAPRFPRSIWNGIPTGAENPS